MINLHTHVSVCPESMNEGLHCVFIIRLDDESPAAVLHRSVSSAKARTQTPLVIHVFWP